MKRFSSTFIFIFTILFAVLADWKCKKENTCNCFKGTGNIIQEERQLSAFHSVLVEDKINVIFQEDTMQKITVEAGKNLIHFVKTELRGDQLYIHDDNKCNFARRYDIPINVYVHYLHNQFYELESKTTGTISSTNACTNDSIDLNIESSGDINFEVAGHGSIYTHQHGAGDLTLSGTADEVIIYSTGSGFTFSDACTNLYTWIYTTTTGKITVDPTNILTGQIDGSGNVYYKGNPGTITIQETDKGKLLPLQ